MPKLPEQHKTSVLEVLDKKTYSTGEITFPKVPKHSIVFKHHLKLIIFLAAVVILLGLVFVAGKSVIKEEKSEGGSEQPVLESNFKSYSRGEYANLNFNHDKNFFVDKIDRQAGIIECLNTENPEERYFVRVGENTRFVSGGSSNLEGTASSNLDGLDEINFGTIISVISIDNPQETKYLNAQQVKIIIKTNP